MYSIWTKHLKNEEEIKNFQDKIQSAKPVLDRMLSILIEEEEDLERLELSSKQFDQPNWAERQAFHNGDKSRLRKTMKLVDLDQQRN